MPVPVYLYGESVNGHPLYDHMLHTPTPPVLVAGDWACVVKLWYQSGRPPSPYPLDVQPTLNGQPLGPVLSVPSWPATLTVSVPAMPNGVYVLAFEPQGVDPALCSAYAGQVILGQGTAQVPILPMVMSLAQRQEGPLPAWVDLDTLPKPVADPRTFRPARPYSHRPGRADLWVDHITPRIGGLWQPWQVQVRDAADTRLILPLTTEFYEDWRLIGPLIDRMPRRDGERGIGYATAYMTGMVGMDPPGHCYFVEHGEKRARFGEINAETGEIETIAGWRSKTDVIPYNPHDRSIDEALIASTYERVGTADVDLNTPLDLWQNPQDCDQWYIADTMNHRIVLIDEEDQHLHTYAGMVGQAGYRDGAMEQALFNTPTSLTGLPDGTIYVCDNGNHCVRMITPDGIVSTLLGLPYAPGYPRLDQFVPMKRDLCRQKWLVDGSPAVARLCYPFCIRVDSHGRLLILEPWFGTIRRYDPLTETLRTVWLQTWAPNATWQWFALSEGTCGPVDDVYFLCAVGRNNIAFSRIINDFSAEELLSGASGNWQGPLTQTAQGHYPWTVATSPASSGAGAVWCTSYGFHGVTRVRLREPDEVPENSKQQGQLMRGQKLWWRGDFALPLGVSPSPSLSLPWGNMGCGNVMGETFGILDRQCRDAQGKPDDTALWAWIMAHWGASLSPTLGQVDREALCYFVRRMGR